MGPSRETPWITKVSSVFVSEENTLDHKGDEGFLFLLPLEGTPWSTWVQRDHLFLQPEGNTLQHKGVEDFLFVLTLERKRCQGFGFVLSLEGNTLEHKCDEGLFGGDQDGLDGLQASFITYLTSLDKKE